MPFDSYKSKYGASGGASGTTRKKYTADDIRGMLSGRTYGPQSEEEYRKQKERKRTYTAEDIRTMLGGNAERERKKSAYESYVSRVNSAFEKYNRTALIQSAEKTPTYRAPGMFQSIMDEVESARKGYESAKEYGRYLSTDEEIADFNKRLGQANTTLDEIYKAASQAADYYKQFKDSSDFDDYMRLSAMDERSLEAEREKTRKELNSDSYSILGGRGTALVNAISGEKKGEKAPILGGRGAALVDAISGEKKPPKSELESRYARINSIYNSKIAAEMLKTAQSDTERDKYVQAAQEAFKKNPSATISPTTMRAEGSDYGKIMLGMATLPKGRKYGAATGQQMTEDEKNTFLYYAGKDGEDAAMRYYHAIEEGQNYKAGQIIKKIYEELPLDTTLINAAAGLQGIRSGGHGIAKLFTGDTSQEATSPNQYAAALHNEQLGTLEKLYADVVSNFVMNLPSMLVSAGIGGNIGATVGSVMLGTNAAGNKYTEMVNRGYDAGTAATAGVLVGLSETCLEKALTSVGGAVKSPVVSKWKIGGRTIEEALATASERIALKHPLLSRFITAASHTAGDFIGEFVEESLQDILEPVIDAAVAGDDISNIEIDLEQALYSGIVGGISGAMHSIVGQGVNGNYRRVTTAEQAQNVIDNGRVKSIIENALSFPEGSAVRTYAEELRSRLSKDGGEKNISAADIQTLLSQIQTFAAKAAENQGKISDEELFETAESVATEIYGDTQPFARDLAAYARDNRDMDIGENELKAMVRDYRFRYGQSVAEYARDYDSMYKAGARNESWIRAKDETVYRTSGYFDSKTRLAAYNAGMKTHVYRDGVSFNFGSEEVRRDFESSNTGAAVRAMSELFSELGYAKKIVVTDRTYSENGEHIALGSTRGNDTVILNYEDVREGGSAFFLGHEVGELMKKNDPVLHAEMREKIIETVYEAYQKSGQSFADMVYERAELYGLDISTKEGQDAVQDEIANNAVGLYFSHPGTVDKMVRKDVSFVVKMKDYFKAFLQKLKDFFTNPPVRMKYDEVEVVKSQAAELEKILSVTEDAIERYRAELAEKRTADSASKKADGKNADAGNANKKADNTAGKDADADNVNKKADNTAGKDAEENAYALSPEARSEIDEYLEYAETNRDLLGEFEKALFESMRGLKAENEYVDAKNRELRRKFANPMHYKHVYDEIMKADLTKELSEADIKRALYRLGKDYYGKALPDTIKKSITDFYYLLANSTPDTITALDVRKKAIAIAYDIVRNAAFADDTLRNDRAAVREVLQGQHIYVSQRDVSELEHEFGRYGAVKNKLWGSKIYLTQSREDGIAIDKLWSSLNDLDVNSFPPDIPTSEMFSRLLKETEKWKFGTSNPFEQDFGKAAQAVANSILDEYANIREVKNRARLLRENEILKNEVLKMKKDFSEYRRTAKEEIYSSFERRKKRERLLRDTISLAKKVKDGKMPNELVNAVVDLEKMFGYNRKNREGGDTLKTRQLAEAQAGISGYSSYGEHSGLADYIKSFASRDDDQISGLDRESFETLRSFAEVFREGKETGGAFGRKNIDEMTDIELEAAYGIAEYFINQANNQNKLRADRHAKSVAEVGMETIRELGYAADGSSVYESDRIRTHRKPSERAEKLGMKKLYDKVVLNSLDSFTLFHKLGDTAERLFGNLYDGHLKAAALRNEARTAVADMQKKHGVDAGKAGKTKHEVKIGGKTLEITTAQAMDMYLTMKRGGQSMGHIEGLGFVLRDEKGNASKILTFNPSVSDGLRFWELTVGYGSDMTADERAEADKTKTPEERAEIERLKKSLRGIGKENTILINENDLNRITGVLSESERRFADDMQKYIVEHISPLLNEQSLEMTGNAKYTERNYWPIESNNTFIDRKIAEEAKNRRFDAILHQGFTKNLVKNASNVIVIGNALDRFTKHVFKATELIGEGAALSDLTAWYNYKDGHYSVRSAIEDYMGKAATQYIEQFFADLNGSAGKVEGFGLWEKAFRNVKAASVLANVRVFVQQHTSLVRAHLSDLDWRYIVKGEEQMIAGKYDIGTVEKYCGTALLKSMGGWTTYVGKSGSDWLWGRSDTVQKLQDAAGYLAQKGDEWTLRALFGAAVEETKAKQIRDENGNLLSGEALLRYAGKRCDRILNETQVIDSVFHRPGWMRSENIIAKQATAFMSEPMKTANIFFRLAGDFRHADKAGRAATAKKMGVALYTFAFNSALTAAAAALVDVMRHNPILDDDAEKDILKRYEQYWTDAFLDNLNPIEMNPLTKYAKENVLGAQSYKKAEITELAVANAVTAVKEAVKYARGESKYSAGRIVLTTVNALSSITGIPAYALFRDLRAGVTGVLDIAIGDDEEAREAVRGVVREYFK